MERFIFPRWVDAARPLVALLLLAGPVYLVGLVAFGASPLTTDVGYAPEQPVPFSHALHVGDLGMDCRYCHTTVESGAVAAVPPTSSCMGCHSTIKAESPLLAPVRESYATGDPVEWVRVHDLPDYVFFDHSAHVNAGVSCAECHGRVDTMEVVRQVQPLSMSWCLDCHRTPDAHLRPPELVTQMDWQPDPEEQPALGAWLREKRNIQPSMDCSTCHR